MRSGSGTTGRACSQQPPTSPGRPTEPRKQWTPAEAFGALLADAIAGSPFSDVLAPRRFTGAAAITQVIAGSWRGRTRDTIRSSGYVVHTLEAAIWSVARTGDFRGAVLLAANLADDADTVAAVTGQLAGALYGLNAIPDHWRERVAWKDRLLAAARRLLSEPVVSNNLNGAEKLES